MQITNVVNISWLGGGYKVSAQWIEEQKVPVTITRSQPSGPLSLLHHVHITSLLLGNVGF